MHENTSLTDFNTNVTILNKKQVIFLLKFSSKFKVYCLFDRLSKVVKMLISN